MKFLVVFVSVLVLVAHGNDTPSKEEDGVYELKSEVVAGYARQEAGGPQVVFAEETPAGVFGAEEEPRVGSPQELQRVYAVEEPASERVPALESGVYIPMISRDFCTNTACANICHRLGFKIGFCKSLFTCWCSN